MYEREWPLAYIDVDLTDHLVRTALLASCLFDGDVRVVARRANTDKDTLYKILMISALFHDLGKASQYYLERWNEKGELRFPYHEMISALFLFQASYEALDHPMKACIFATSAKVVSRHHVAMRGRHPKDYSEEDYSKRVRRFDELKSIAEKLDANVVNAVLYKMLSEPELRGVRQEVELLKSKVSQILSNFKLAISQKVSLLANLNEDSGYACGNMNELIVVRACAGFLIVADNIVASYERRDAEDYPTQVYIENWKRELKNMNDCSYILRRPLFLSK